MIYCNYTDANGKGERVIKAKNTGVIKKTVVNPANLLDKDMTLNVVKIIVKEVSYE